MKAMHTHSQQEKTNQFKTIWFAYDRNPSSWTRKRIMQLAKGKETQKSVSNLRYYFISLSILLLLLLLLLKYVSYMFSLSLSISICCEWVFPYNVITTKYSPVINHQHQTLEINVLERGAFISLIHSLVICISHSLLDCCDVGMEWGGGNVQRPGLTIKSNHGPCAEYLLSNKCFSTTYKLHILPL